MRTHDELEKLRTRFPYEPEYLQAISEVLTSIEEVYNQYPEFDRVNLMERLCIPDRVFSFRVTWMDDNGRYQNNMGYRVQHNNAIGPYKGGLRFHPSVNPSVLKFLAFEQTLKNALTTLPMGGAKGGSDFDPKGKSDTEIMRFCQAFILELHKYIGAHTDVPAGDIGVGAREIGYMFGMYKKLKNEFSGVFTGKGLEYGGSLIRPEATGYGNIYFLMNMLQRKGIEHLNNQILAISGSGNVALHTAQKAIKLGAKVITLSDSDGYIYDPEGLSHEKLAFVFHLKTVQHGRIREYAEKYGCKYIEKSLPWKEKCTIALPCATQNELTGEDAKALLSNGCFAVSEGANMPSTPEAVNTFLQSKILYAPGKAANAGGVSVSGLEMAQNSMRLGWNREEVDNKLKSIVHDIHEACVKHGTEPDGYVNYVKGANVAGFMKVAKAMMAQGMV